MIPLKPHPSLKYRPDEQKAPTTTANDLKRKFLNIFKDYSLIYSIKLRHKINNQQPQ